MTRKYKFFYSADILTVVAAGQLQPVGTTDINIQIDLFEKDIYALVDSNNDNNYAYQKYKKDDLITFLDEDNKTPNPRPLPSDDPFAPEKGTVFGQAWVYSGCKFETTFPSLTPEASWGS